MVNSSWFASDLRIDKSWGDTLREKLPRSVRLRHENWGCQQSLTFLQEIDNGMESRTTPIQEGEDDEDVAASGTYTLKSDSSTTWTSFPSRIPETVCTKNNATATYGVRLRRNLYGWKDNFISFQTPPDSGPYLFGVNGNSRNKSTSRIWKGAAPPLLGQWPVYRVGPSTHVVGAPPVVAHNPRMPWFFHKLSSRHHLDSGFV